MPKAGKALVAALFAATACMAACRSEDDSRARRMCDEAAALEKNDPRAALRLVRETWEKLPTTGTAGAIECGHGIAKRMGKVRLLVASDERGAPATVDGCEWAADAVEIFDGSTRPPYKERWARRLMERCVTAVGRAWTREPDDERLARLCERLKKLSAANGVR
jgi:hypothetical protein